MGCVLGREVSSGIVTESKGRDTSDVETSKRDDPVAKVEGESKVEEVQTDETQKKEKVEDDHRSREQRRRSRPSTKLGNLPKHTRGEQVAAGWPSWLSDICGESLSGWIPRRANTFEKIDKVGSDL